MHDGISVSPASLTMWHKTVGQAERCVMGSRWTWFLTVDLTIQEHSLNTLTVVSNSGLSVSKHARLQCSGACSGRLLPGSLAGIEKCIRRVSEPGNWNFGFLISPTHAGFLAFPLCQSYFSLYSLFGLKSIFPSLGTAWHTASLSASFLFTHQK